MIPNNVTKLVEGCSACGGTHDIVFSRMKDPIVIEGETFGYSGNCSETNKEVYMRYDEKKETHFG